MRNNVHLVCQLVRREVSSQFKGTVFGFAWAFVRPLLMLAIYAFVFGVIFRRDVDGEPLGAYAVSMFCGLSIYTVFSTSVATSCMSVVSRRGLVQQVVFPLVVLPLVQVLSAFILSIPWFVLLAIGVLWVHGSIPWTVLLVPLWLVPLFLLTQGCAWLVASLGVYFRDMKQLVPVLLQILFFMSPIFWRLEAVQARLPEVAGYLKLNPLTVIIEGARRLIFAAELPDWRLLALVTAGTSVVFALGLAWFQKTKKGFADVI